MRSFPIFCYALLQGLLLLSICPSALKAQSPGKQSAAQKSSGQSPAQRGFNPDSVFADLGLDGESANSVLSHGESSREKIAGNIFIKGSVSKSTCYPGQPVLLTYQLYSALQSSSHISILPALPNCNAIEWPVSNEKVIRRRLGGKEYRVLTIWQVRLLPFREGAITIDTLSVDNDITYTTASGKTGRYSGRISSSPVALNILPLPMNGRPPGFSGSIGNYQIHAAVRSARIQAGETDTLHIEISGSGNLDNVTFPAIAWPKGIESFPSRQHWKIDKDRFPPTGYTSIDIPFVADLPGHRVLPPVSFPYFDASLAAYKTIHSDSISLNVLPAIAKASPASAARSSVASSANGSSVLTSKGAPASAAKALQDPATTVSPTGGLAAKDPGSSSFKTYGWMIGLLLLFAGCSAWFYYTKKKRRPPGEFRLKSIASPGTQPAAVQQDFVPPIENFRSAPSSGIRHLPGIETNSSVNSTPLTNTSVTLSVTSTDHPPGTDTRSSATPVATAIGDPHAPATNQQTDSETNQKTDPDTHFRATLEQLTGSTDPTGFYPGLKAWLDSFLRSRLVTSSCSEADLLALLRAHTVEKDLLEKVSFIYRSCGEFQYSPAGTEAAVSELSGFAWTILEKVPANIKNTYPG